MTQSPCSYKQMQTSTPQEDRVYISVLLEVR